MPTQLLTHSSPCVQFAKLHPVQIGHRDMHHCGLECRTFSNETKEINQREKSEPCRRQCTCGLPHGNAMAGVTEDCYQHNLRLHLLCAFYATHR